EHGLADPHRVGIARAAPGEIAPRFSEPGAQLGVQLRGAAARGAFGASPRGFHGGGHRPSAPRAPTRLPLGPGPRARAGGPGAGPAPRGAAGGPGWGRGPARRRLFAPRGPGEARSDEPHLLAAPPGAWLRRGLPALVLPGAARARLDPAPRDSGLDRGPLP